MPIDISTEATTRSMIRNGRNSRKSYFKGALELGNHESRNEDAHRKIFWLLRRFLAGQIHEQSQILFADIFLHEPAQRSRCALECLVHVDLVGDQRLDADVVNARENRPHHEGR